MSTDGQEDSIDRQRSTVLPHCERKGYRVVAEFKDEGVADDEFAKRPGLQRLLAAAAAARPPHPAATASPGRTGGAPPSRRPPPAQTRQRAA
jgi:hypothetical protein